MTASKAQVRRVLAGVEAERGAGACKLELSVAVEEAKTHETEGRTGKGSGQLHPAFVECLMGLPIGWTDPDRVQPDDWPGWPARPRQPQHAYEPPRLAGGIKDRVSRLKALGNSVVGAQAAPLFRAIVEMERAQREGGDADG